MEIDLNSDLGEGYGLDTELMPLITSANICCGFHAGDAPTARTALDLAAQNSVQVGAHPGYPDRENFGRRELGISEDEIYDLCLYQVGALDGLARINKQPLHYIKPHGALYNQACRDDAYARPVIAAAEALGLALVGLPGSRLEALSTGSCAFIAEGFADRRYQSDGSLVPRSRSDAFIEDAADAVRQAQWLIREYGVRTLCVHGDNPRAVAFVLALRTALEDAGFTIRAFGMSLEVLQPGWASRVVDMGRPGARHLGVPVGGAADRTALVLGNALVGNAPNAAALEVCLSGPRLRAIADIACVVYGAPVALTRPWTIGKTFTLRSGEELQIGGSPQGVRAYLCVRGGLQTPMVLGSRSALEPLGAGQLLPCPGAVTGVRHAPRIQPRFTDPQALCVLPGLQASWFREEEFYRQEFTATSASNRMGLRLQGEPLTMPQQELVSEPVAPGAVQVTRDGQCIVLGVDGQTIGGYPKIAHVIDADLDWLGQLRPGQRVRFARVAMAEATTRWREQSESLRRWVLRLRAASS